MTLDAKGRSGGLSLGVKKGSLKLLSSWGSEKILGADVYSQELCSESFLLNIYGPCQDFSLGLSETWGPVA